MSNFPFNFIRIDIKNIKTVEDCKRILFDNDIKPKDIDPEKVFSAKSKHDTLFFDATSLLLVAYIKKNGKDITLVYDLVDEMMALQPINDKSKDTSELSLDFILDKINSFGFKSLTEKEKTFLDSTSKK